MARPPDIQWGARTYVMGIVNVTPDSFSGDGLATPGRPADDVAAAALELAREFVAAGADILDVGAESTRPPQVYGEHPPVDAATELASAVPVVHTLAAELGDRALVSIDTSKGVVALEALRAGAAIVNDVWAATRDPTTADAAASHGAYLVLMHNRDEMDDYADGVFSAVVAWLHEAIEAAVSRGVPRDRLIVDPGIGFGKTPRQSVELLHRLDELKAALGGLPLLVGTSRKRFIGQILDGAPPSERLEGTAASVALAIAAGADIVRVHDVAPIVRTVRVSDAIVRFPGAGP
jgi:dihydropteroate synthase